MKHILSKLEENLKILAPELIYDLQILKNAIHQGEMPDFSWLKQGVVLLKYLPDLDSFIEDNSDILSQFDVKKYLGSGYHGDAWLLDDGRVLKIQQGLAHAYKKMQKFLFEQEDSASKNYPMIYEVGQFRKDNIAYIIMEHVPTMKQNLEEHNKINIVDDILNYFQKNADKISKHRNLFLNASTIEGAAETGSVNNLFREYISNLLWVIKGHISDLFLEAHGRFNFDNAFKDQSLKEVKKQFNKSDLNELLLDLQSFFPLGPNFSERYVESVFNNLLLNRHDLHIGNFGNRGDDLVFYDG